MGCLLMGCPGVPTGGQGRVQCASENIWKKDLFNVICNDCAAQLSQWRQENPGFQGFGGGHYVQTRPAICDDRHGLNRAWAVTMRVVVLPFQDMDRFWPI